MKTAASTFAILAIMASVSLLPAAPAFGLDLASYVSKQDPTFGFEATHTEKQGSCTVTILKLRSGEWKGSVWTHRLVVIRPDEVKTPGIGVLVISGGSNRNLDFTKTPGDAKMGVFIAAKTGTVVAFLGQVPNQPLFDGLHEDEIIALTFKKFMETGDPEWPLLLPMTRSAVRAMDAVQEFLKKEHGQDQARFLVTGASKRGWTTWLTAAADARVAAMAPMVIDVLDIPRQMKHQVDTWGEYSEMIHDYSDLGLMDLLVTEKGKPLMDLVDPWSYREKYTMPKMVILGTNDRYWPADAARFYFPGMPGEKHLHYVPNAGHGLDLTIVQTLIGYFEDVSAGVARPEITWEYSEDADRLTVTVTAKTAPEKAELFSAASPTRDMRDAKWAAAPMEKTSEGKWAGSIPKPAGGFTARFASLTFRSGGGTPYRVCSMMRVHPAFGD